MATPQDDIREIVDKFSGTWKEVAQENVDKFFSSMGMPFLMRKMMTRNKPNVTISVKGSEITIAMTDGPPGGKEPLVLNKDMVLKGRQGNFNAKMTYEDGKLVMRQTPVDKKDAKEMQTIRYLNSNRQMVMELRQDDVVAKRIYEKEK